MNNELESLRARIERLESERRKGMLFVGTLALLVVVGWAQSPRAQEKVSARKFELVAANGKVAADLSARDDYTTLRFYDSKGEAILEIARNNDQAFCDIGTKASKASISAGKALMPGIILRNEAAGWHNWISDRFMTIASDKSTSVFISAENVPQITIRREGSPFAAGLAVSDSFADLRLERSGRSVGRICADMEGGSMQFGADGMSGFGSALLVAHAKGSSLVLRDSNGGLIGQLGKDR